MPDQQFADRFQNYASAGLRWGLMLEDHPDAHRTYTEAKGRDLGEPFSARWPDKTFVVCMIEIPGHGDIHYGYKEVPTHVRRRKQNGTGYDNVPWDNTLDNYLILQTQACGRALRSAGYPHSIPDLKLVLLWRRRNAEVEALVEALEGAAGDEDADDAEEEGATPPAQRRDPGPSGLGTDPQVGRETWTHPAAKTADVMVPVLADDASRAMWDQMTEPVRDELKRWLAESARKPATTRAYIKFLLDREHKTMTGGDEGDTGTAPPESPESPGDWVTRSTDAIANGPTDAPPEEVDAEQAALLEGVKEVRERLLALAGTRPNDYALALKALEGAGIALKERIGMEQLMTADEIVGRYEHANGT